MKDKQKRLCALLMSILLVVLALPTAALAAGKIMTDQPVSLTITYSDGAKPIPNARFSVFRVADIDEYGELTLTAACDKYRNSVSGLAAPENLTDEQWRSLASTLRGYVLEDGGFPVKEGKTDNGGVLLFAELPVGLYLVLGNRATTDDFYTYTPVPFMVLLPGRNPAANDWNYEITASPKYTKDYNPPEKVDDYITRKVLKVWNDSGYESIRPADVTVHLLRDGAVFDTQTLNKDNNWRYAWDNLDAHYEWDLTENPVPDYAVSIERTGITYTVSNKYIVPVKPMDPPVQKRIVGDAPQSDSTFTFVMTAADASCPMPEGSSGTVKEITITGAGAEEFGEIVFTKLGTYAYSISEKNTGIEGYTYDSAVYTVTYDVTEKDGELCIEQTIRNSDGEETSAVEFTNKYQTPGEKLPQTGVLWWPVPLLVCAGLMLIIIGIICRRRYS